jgi:hypothetical protein
LQFLFYTQYNEGDEIMNQIVLLDSATKSSGATLDSTSLQVTFSASTTNGVKSSLGFTSGKWYCEVTVNSGTYGMIGIVDSTVSMNSVIYNAVGERFYYGNNGNKYVNGGTSSAYGSAYGVNDTISILLDLDNKKLEFWKNGISQGVMSTDLAILSGNIYIALGLGTGSAHTYTVNFGATAFKYAIPTGYNRMTSINKTLILCSDGTYRKLDTTNGITFQPSPIPTMSSPTAPSGQVFSTGTQSYSSNLIVYGSDSAIGSDYSASSNDYSKAFDNNATTYWKSTTTTGWLGINFQGNVAKIINSYTIQGYTSAPTTAPKSWTFEGSNNGSTWTVLDTQSGWSWTGSEAKTFYFTNFTAYSYYRVNVSAVNGGTFIGIMELSMFKAFLPYYAFDKTNGVNDCFGGYNSPTIGYKFPTAKVIRKYSITSSYGALGTSPKNWTFEGSNDGVNYTILDTQTGVNFTATNQQITFNIPTNDNAYLFYRISLLASQDNFGSFQIGQIDMFEGDYNNNLWSIQTSTTPTVSDFNNGITDFSIINNSMINVLEAISPQVQLVHYVQTGNLVGTINTTYLDIQKESVYNSLPLGQILIEDVEVSMFGDFKQIYAVNVDYVNSNGTVKYAVSFDNGISWNAYKNGAWQTVSLNTVDSFKLGGMSVTEVNSIPVSEINTKAVNRKIKLAYLLDENAQVQDYAQIDKVQLMSNVGTNTTKINQLSMYLLNTVATINMTLSGARITGSVSDTDLTRVQYRILLNGNTLYPVDGSFTTLQPSPANINFNIPQDRMLFNQNNTIRVEFQDYYGQTDYWEQTFFGQYYGLMIKDSSGNYMTDNVGTALKYMNFGIIISGQITMSQHYTVVNTYGYDLKNVVIKPKYEYNEPRAVIQISPTDSPFVEQEQMVVGNMANNQVVDFYVRVATAFDAQPISTAKFEVQVLGDKA